MFLRTRAPRALEELKPKSKAMLGPLVEQTLLTVARALARDVVVNMTSLTDLLAVLEEVVVEFVMEDVVSEVEEL